jgi:hypothetical protein
MVVTALAGCGTPETRGEVESASPEPPPSAQSLMETVVREEAAKRYDNALLYARTLVDDHPGTSEADSAASLVPRFELAVEAAREAERKRVAEAAAAAEARRLAEKWAYSSTTDPMTSGTSRFASIVSENTVSFRFPYEGEQRARLTLRDHPSYGRDVILRIEQGQFLCESYSGCMVRVRFDEGRPEQWNAGGPSDHSTTSLFIRNYSRFVQRLRSAKVVRIQAGVYQEGQPTFEFHVGGFDSERYGRGG